VRDLERFFRRGRVVSIVFPPNIRHVLVHLPSPQAGFTTIGWWPNVDE